MSPTTHFEQIRVDLLKEMARAGLLRIESNSVPVEPADDRLIVLLADDHEDSLEGYALFLRLAGHTVHTAADGRTAINLARSVCPDVVVVDVRMPDISGHDVVQALRTDGLTAHLPILLVTGVATETMPSPELGGANGYATKPCPPNQLLALIEGLALPR